MPNWKMSRAIAKLLGQNKQGDMRPLQVVAGIPTLPSCRVGVAASHSHLVSHSQRVSHSHRVSFRRFAAVAAASRFQAQYGLGLVDVNDGVELMGQLGVKIVAAALGAR